jgi:choline-sulfatase
MRARSAAAILALTGTLVACSGPASERVGGARPVEFRSTTPRHLVIVTIDTLRADRVGVYGYARARTPVIDDLARAGRRMVHAYASAPITLTSHASLLTGLNPPAHGAMHNGIALAAGTPTLATLLQGAGFATGAFVAAFPLDRRFNLAAGFDIYGDALPRDASGRPADERPGRVVVDEALAWWRSVGDRRAFLWVHLFEPHAPYGDAAAGRSAAERYDDEIAEADHQVGRLLEGLGPRRAETLVAVTADHGEAFGEHGEIAHSVFVYDTTLRVPLVLHGPGVTPGVYDPPVGLVDVAPTALGLLGVPGPVMDGQAFDGPAASALDAPRPLYAETEAPLHDFGWSPLRAIRVNGRKFIEAPTPELYDLTADAAETRSLAADRPDEVATLRAAVREVAARRQTRTAGTMDADARRRLQSLGYLGGAGPTGGKSRPDPKDRRELAARLAEITSGELAGEDLERALAAVVRDDPGNPQARVRLGHVLAAAGRCPEALPHFHAAIAAHLPTADAHLGLAGCLASRRAFAEAIRVVDEGGGIDGANPVVLANQGILRSDAGQPRDAVPYLRRALAIDSDFHQARFALAIALARSGDRAAAEGEALELLKRLPPDAPQRPEVERLRSALR